MINGCVIKGLSRFEARRLQRQIDRRKARKINRRLSMTPAEAKALDAFYTRPIIAKFVADFLKNLVAKDAVYLEPAAGGGAFLDQFPGAVGLDIHPTRADVIRANFLTGDVASTMDREKLVIVGNPPFGQRGKLAVEFLNRSLTFAKTVGFIVPMSFGYHEVQGTITPGARLVVDVVLPKGGYTLAGRAVNVASRFQVWTTDPNVSPKVAYEGWWKAVGQKPRVTVRPGGDLRRHADALENDDLQLVRWRAGGRSPRFTVAFPFTKVRDYAANLITRASDLVVGRDYWLIVAKRGAEGVADRLRAIDLKAIANMHHHRGQRFVGVDILRQLSVRPC